MELDLDNLTRMAKSDPAGFELAKRELIQTAILRAKLSSQEALAALQKTLELLEPGNVAPYVEILKLSSHLAPSLSKLDEQILDLRLRYSSV